MQSLTATRIAQFNEIKLVEDIRTKAFSLLFNATSENQIFEFDMFHLFVIFDLCTLSKGTKYFLRVFTQLHCIQICINQFIMKCHSTSDTKITNETNLNKLVNFLAQSICGEFNCVANNFGGSEKMLQQSMISFFRCTAIYQSHFNPKNADLGKENMFSKLKKNQN